MGGGDGEARGLVTGFGALGMGNGGFGFLSCVRNYRVVGRYGVWIGGLGFRFPRARE